MSVGENVFCLAFEALSGGHAPFPWQYRLCERLARGEIPRNCLLPTGLGKTSIILIWLIALTHANSKPLPRRLVYIVNRRTVVDQATEMVERLRERLRDPCNPRWCEHRDVLRLLVESLRRVGGTNENESPLAVSTLRGELADNGEWKENPARPAIIIGTVDLIGSKLLFSGYGDGRYGRAHHAGLIGQDAFFVHDEAHLEPAFDALLRSVAAEQARCGESRPICVMSLSATARSSQDTAAADPAHFGISDEDRKDRVVNERLNAVKVLRLVDVEKGKEAGEIVAHAMELGTDGARVLVYVRSPEWAKNVRDGIIRCLKQRAKDIGVLLTDEEAGGRVGLLTGTIRGKERDDLVRSSVFRAFEAGPNRPSSLPHALFLVSTSAGEVGADWDADHLVCDLTTLDGMIQRLGRVNRLGGDRREARIRLVLGPIDDKDPLNAPMRKTLDALKRLPVVTEGFNASPEAVSNLLARDGVQDAFSPMPTILPATDILFDHWSLTSITGEMPGRPEVGAYLHGVAEWEPPETHVAWRADIALLAVAGGKDDRGEHVPCSAADLEAVFDVFPLRAAEQLRDRTDRVQAELSKIAKRLSAQVRLSAASTHPNNDHSEDFSGADHGIDVNHEAAKWENGLIGPNPWVVLMRGGSVEWVRLQDLAPSDKHEIEQARRRLAFATVVLPVEAGGLKGGMLDGDEPAPLKATCLDVAEIPSAGRSDRQRVWLDASDNGDVGKPLLGGERMNAVARHSVTLAGDEEEDTSLGTIEYCVAKGEEHEPGVRVELGAHNAHVETAARQFAETLGLSEEIVRVFALAGKYHDAGKAREVWQRYAGNPDGTVPIAKSERYRDWRMLGGYRHEFGSLLDAGLDLQIRDHPERDLILHLIAAHHGWARPHFEPQAYDNEGPRDPVTGHPLRPTTFANEGMAVDVMRRFGRLQQRFGRWGLAWLESILRCADAMVSISSVDFDAAPTGHAGSTRFSVEKKSTEETGV